MSKIKAQKDLVLNLKSTDEYKRSKAIAGCITFLSEKIKELETEKTNLTIKLEEITKKNQLLLMKKIHFLECHCTVQ